MAGFRLPSLKSLANLSGISARVSTGPQHFQQLKKFQNLVQHRHRSSTASSVNLSSERINDNVVYSRHEDCFLHTQTMVQRFFEQASLWPNHTAVECGITGRKYTYDKVRMLTRRFGSALARMGFKKSEVLGLVLPNLPEFPIVMLGAAGIGMPVTTVNPIYTAEEIARQMQNSGTSVVVTIPQMADTIREVASLCPEIRRLIVVGGPQEGFVSLSEMFQDSGDLFDENIEIDPFEDMFVLPYSSGTTGLPKGVMLTHSNIGANVQQIVHPGTCRVIPTTSSNVSDSFQEVYICVLPFFHIYGMVGTMFTGLDHGAKLVTLPRFESESFLNCLYQHHPTMLQLVPPLVSFLGHRPDLKLEAFHRLHTVFCGAAPLGPAAANKLMDRLGRRDILMQEGYGMTESSPVTHMSPIINNQIGSFGEPVSRTRVKVVDLNTGESLGPGQEGEMCVFGPQVMKGYYKNVKATEETIDSAGWLHTGDIAYYDEQNQFFIVDRLKELIKVKGLQVSPSELEDVLRRHPAVLDVAVIGVPDDIAGELPRAYVVKKNDVSVSKDDIAEFVDVKVAPHKRLKGGVVFIDAIPKTNTGKLLRRELKSMLLSQIS